MKIYSTTYFRRNLADCLAEAGVETVFIQRPGNNRLLQLVIVPEKDVNEIINSIKK